MIYLNLVLFASIGVLIFYLLFKNPYTCDKLDDGRYKYYFKYEKDWNNKYIGLSSANIEHCDAYGKTKEEAKENIEKRLKATNPEIPNIPNVIITRRCAEIDLNYLIPVFVSVFIALGSIFLMYSDIDQQTNQFSILFYHILILATFGFVGLCVITFIYMLYIASRQSKDGIK